MLLEKFRDQRFAQNIILNIKANAQIIYLGWMQFWDTYTHTQRHLPKKHANMFTNVISRQVWL